MANGARTALFFDVFARNKTGQTFSQIIKSTDTLRGKIAAVGKIAAGAAVAGLAVFAAQGVRSFLQFDDQMTQSLAIMGEVSGPMRKRMEEAARAVGRTTRFGASEAAEAYFFLASAGLDAEQSIKAMPQVAKFAQAGMFDLARATDLATDAQSALGLSVDDPAKNLANLTRVTDTLVGANTLANASVEQFSTSLTQKAGPAMRQAGIEIEEGVAALAVFADQGIKAERAGTLFAATLEQLQRQAINNSGEFEQFNIRVFDSEGNLRNMADIVADLEGALGGMSLEQQKATLLQLGFNRSALDGIMALIGSSDALREYQGELEGMGGITEEVAEKQLQSFAARLDLIKSRAADAALVLGGVLVNAAFNVGEHVGEMARMFGELPDSIQLGIGAFVGLAVAAPLAIGAFRKIKSAIETARIALMLMSTTARIATLAMGGIGIALAAGATIMAFFANRNLEAQARVDALADSLDKQTGAITENSREVAFNNLEQSGAIDKAKELGINLETLVDAYLGDKDAIAEVAAATAAATGAKSDLEQTSMALAGVTDQEAEAARGVSAAIREGNESTDAAIIKNRDRRAAGLEAAGADQEMAAAAEAATGEIEEQVSAVEELISALDEMVSKTFAARDAEVSYEQALDDATASLKEHGATLDIDTEKGRKNRTALDKLAESALKDAAATLEDAEAKGNLAAGHDRATAKMKTARSEFVKVAQQMGLSKQQAGALADELGLIPGNYKATVTADTSSARSEVAGFVSWVNQQTGSVHVRTVGATTGSGGRFAEGGFAARGMTALVGEEGPELVTFAQDAHVTPADKTRQLLRNGLANGTGSGLGSGMALGRYLTLLSRGVIRLGDVTDEEWEQLKAIGWQGRAGDRMEALYPPLEGVRREFIKLGEVTDREWRRLMDLGWRGKAGDRMEALYPPLGRLAKEVDQQAKLLRDANLSRRGPSGNKRTWDFFGSGGRSYAHIFATGETLALGKMREDEAGRFLRSIGKLARGGSAARGSTALVGEEGPELVRFAKDARVVPAGETRRLLGGAGGGGTTNGRSDSDLARVLERAFRNAITKSGMTLVPTSVARQADLYARTE